MTHPGASWPPTPFLLALGVTQRAQRHGWERRSRALSIGVPRRVPRGKKKACPNRLLPRAWGSFYIEVALFGIGKASRKFRVKGHAWSIGPKYLLDGTKTLPFPLGPVKVSPWLVRRSWAVKGRDGKYFFPSHFPWVHTEQARWRRVCLDLQRANLTSTTSSLSVWQIRCNLRAGAPDLSSRGVVSCRKNSSFKASLFHPK